MKLPATTSAATVGSSHVVAPSSMVVDVALPPSTAALPKLDLYSFLHTKWGGVDISSNVYMPQSVGELAAQTAPAPSGSASRRLRAQRFESRHPERAPLEQRRTCPRQPWRGCRWINTSSRHVPQGFEAGERRTPCFLQVGDQLLPCGTLPPRDDHSRTRDDKNWKTMEKTYPGKGPKTNLSGYRSSLPFLLVETSASLRVTSALLVVTRTLLIYFKFNSNSFLLLLVRHLLLLAWHLLLLGPKTNLSGRSFVSFPFC